MDLSSTLANLEQFVDNVSDKPNVVETKPEPRKFVPTHEKLDHSTLVVGEYYIKRGFFREFIMAKYEDENGNEYEKPCPLFCDHSIRMDNKVMKERGIVDTKPKRITYKISDAKAALLDVFLDHLGTLGTVYKTTDSKYAVQIAGQWYKFGLIENTKGIPKNLTTLVFSTKPKDKIVMKLLDVMEQFKSGDWHKSPTGVAFSHGGKWFTLSCTASRKEPEPKEVMIRE